MKMPSINYVPTFENIKLSRTLATVNVFSLITAAVAFMAGIMIYFFVKPTNAILFPAMTECLIFLGIIKLNQLKRHRLATALFFAFQNIAVLYYGLVLEPSAGVHLMCVFVAGVSMLLFQKTRDRCVAILIVGIVFTILISNYNHRVIPAVIVNSGDSVLNYIIYPVIFLHIAVLLLLHEANYHHFIEQEKILNKELYEKTLELERSNNFKSAYIRENSHELRSPINVIFLIAEMLNLNIKSKRWLTASSTEMIQDLFVACYVVKAIINNVMELSKSEEGIETAVSSETISVRKFLEEIKNLFQHLAGAKNINIELHVDDSIPKAIKGDKIKLTQIIINILTNAIKFTRENSNIYINLSTEAHEQLNLTIRDEGPGIDPAQIESIFDLFATGNPATGNGIGLHITKRLVNQLGGDITVSSEVNEGCTFAINLPLIATEEEEPDYPVEDVFEGAGLSALIIEDDGLSQKYLSKFLHFMGLKTTVAGTGREGLLKLGATNFSVIFLDAFLPDMNAVAVMSSLREMNVTTPIILTSGDKFNNFISKFTNAEHEVLDQATDYLSKPFSARELNDSLKKAFGRYSSVME